MIGTPVATRAGASLALILLLAATPASAQMARDVTTKVRASWYDCAQKGECSRSKRTANGEKFNPDAKTCAHRKLRFNTIVRVAFAGRAVNCRVNDRGPFVPGRSIDLSRATARAIAMPGVAMVDMTVLR